jgi:transposase
MPNSIMGREIGFPEFSFTEQDVIACFVRIRQNDRERAVGMVQAGMTHQAVADHFNVSRITISRLTIRLRQTGRTNDRARNDRPLVTSQRQDRHLLLTAQLMTAVDLNA